MPNIISVSGWGQPHDSLATLMPEALPIGYARHRSVQAALLAIAAHESEPDLAVGWSLGGQLLVRAIAAGLLKPRRLVLIAAPFQFVKTPELAIGMPRDLFVKFRENYQRNPLQTLTKAWELIAKDDTNDTVVRQALAAQDKQAVTAQPWLEWLDHLESFSCENLHFAAFPPTLLIHGKDDLVVYQEQSQYFKQAMPHAQLLSIEGCGHAPHWHDAVRVRQAIKAFHEQ